MKVLKQTTNKKGTFIHKKSLYIFLLIIMNLVSCNEDDSPPPQTTILKDEIENQDFVAAIEENISDLPNFNEVAIAIIDNESTEFIGIHKDNGILRRTNNANSIYEIGSITKLFTNICLSKLIYENKATLSESLSDQFDYAFLAGADITLEQLANHTSGLPRLPSNVDEIVGFNQNDPYAIYSEENLKSYFENHIVLNATSGTQYEYSNLGTGTLGYILSRKLEMNFEEMLQSQIFTPLGMTSSTSLINNVDTERLVQGYLANGNKATNWSFSEVMSGAGSIKSTLTDLEKFVRKNFEVDQVYNLPQEFSFTIDDEVSIGLGWTILESEGSKFLFHNGGTAGYSSEMFLDKDNKKAIVILSNISSTTSDYSEKLNALAFSLLSIISD